ncbi:MAG: hypothetical protein CVU62_13200 [Deltaproteobacteria bacterium HGW-Deltaproteobacteria-2]|jgi:hypothetical protein|nr:MAG: hypothetical protein CVU62_13200 [Deltaproteobacteria bacterium HGW-Deltaproteobacteria-2]
MALIKIIDVGNELVFEVPASEKPQKISIFLTEKAGRKAVLKITADRSIPIKHYKQQIVGQ